MLGHQVNELWDKGLIHPNLSPNCSPVCFVQKQDHHWNMNWLSYMEQYNQKQICKTKDYNILDKSGGSMFSRIDLIYQPLEVSQANFNLYHILITWLHRKVLKDCKMRKMEAWWQYIIDCKWHSCLPFRGNMLIWWVGLPMAVVQMSNTLKDVCFSNKISSKEVFASFYFA